jgi:hypothetical protein
MIELDVFVDESGLFVETSTVPADRLMAHGQDRKFPSQLAGVIASTKTLGEGEAEKILKSCCKQAGTPFTNQFHANELNPGAYSSFVIEAIKQFQKHKLQAFRIVNEEQVSFGDRVSNYTNILAELLVRICHQQSKTRFDSIALNVNAARVTLPNEETGEQNFIERKDYLKRIEESFAQASIRKGYGSQTKNWKLKSFRLGSGKDDKTLQLCDLVSNASHANFVKCDQAASGWGRDQRCEDGFARRRRRPARRRSEPPQDPLCSGPR